MAYVIMIIAFIVGILQIDFANGGKIKSWVLLILSVVALILAIIYECRNSFDKKYEKNTGKLDGTLKAHYKDAVWAIGGTIFKFTGDTGDIRLLSPEHFGDIDLKMWVDQNKLFVDTKIRDGSGNYIAVMSKNEWTTNNILDRNFDDKALEVKDTKDRVVLQASFDGEKINLCGFYYKKDGSAVVFYPTDSGALINITKQPDNLDNIIIPMFKYPSELHKGERVSNTK